MIKLENINKTYNNGSPLHVLKGIDLSVEEGELVSIMGASGSGKSASSTTTTAATTTSPGGSSRTFRRRRRPPRATT